MKIKTILKIIDGKFVNENGSFNKIKLDSRCLNKNDLFIAINNGYKYIDEALKKGCKVITDKDVNNTIKVENSIIALGKIALYLREKYDKDIIAITGSNGKTTTKELIYSVLSKKFQVLKNDKNKNNDIGLPETLLDLNDKYDICVLELGMNHQGEIDYLGNICKPDYSVITNIGSSHIGNLGSIRNILKTKLEIIKHSGKVLVNGDNKYLNKVRNTNKVSIKEMSNIEYYIDRTEFDYNNTHFIFNIPGKHLLIDVLFAIKLGLIYRVNINDIKDAIYEFQPIEGRMNIIRDKFTIIDDSYNSNFESLSGSLELLKNDDRFKYIILGDMLELGKYSKMYHKKINKILKKINNKKVLLIGEYTKYIDGEHFDNKEEIIDYLNELDLNGSIILVKGSHAFELDEIIKRLI